MCSGILLVILFSINNVVIAEEWFQTPHGLRPKECIINHNESNAIITKVDNGLDIFYPISKTRKYYPTSAKCIKNAQDIISAHKNRKYPNIQDGWDIFVWYEQNKSNNSLGRFDSVYILPNQTLPETNQLLYYFISLSNGPNNETIIQPVIAYCGSSSCGFSYDYDGWEMAAWNCCPQGLSNYGKGVKLSAADKVTAHVSSDPNNGNIQVYMESTAGVSQLNEKGDYRVMNYGEIAGEFYSYTNCNQFNSLPITFTQLSMKDTHGNAIVPKWTVINNNALNCGGNITIVNATEVTIKARK
eukprot:450703_1